jgi:hypothetical protein
MHATFVPDGGNAITFHPAMLLSNSGGDDDAAGIAELGEGSAEAPGAQHEAHAAAQMAALASGGWLPPIVGVQG